MLLPRVAEAADGSDSHSVIASIALCMVAASAFGVLMRALRQPLILGYLLAGIAIGPIGLGLINNDADIRTVAEIGLILLLFMIGLEIDLRKMLSAGRFVTITGMLQFPLCAAAVFGVLVLLEQSGMSVGSSYTKLYFAIAASLSSTMIVVKLLYDKFELDTLPGRITVGVLVFQDIWAIILLAVQPNMANPQVGPLLATFAAGGLLVAAALLASRYVLPRIFHSVAKVPELMLVLSLGWCFLVCLVAAHPKVGLSMEMGALIAGISLATFPYNLDVIGKVVSIRDFFITLFFVGLAMQIPVPELSVVVLAAILAVVAVIARFAGIFTILYALRAGHRASLLATLNLSQVSEFSLVIAALGVTLGHIDPGALTTLIWVFSVLAVASTYLIGYSHGLQSKISGLLRRVGLKDLGGAQEYTDKKRERPIVLLGFFRLASAFIDEASRRHQHLLEQITVVDFNPIVKQKLDALGVHCVYGDISHPDTLHHAGIHDARVVLSTVPDAFLKGTNNAKVLSVIRALCPHAKIVVTAEQPSRAKELYAAGADYVLQPSAVAGAAMVPVVEQALHEALQNMREEALSELEQRREVLA
ncbi:MAG: cation:proton antiporter [Deltaproteobacteria bacterium]|nr:cation:proton antiporter [Deltaproteobacteria bacterium]